MMKKQLSGQGVVILGAGLSGLSAAYHVGPQACVYEAAARPGGECVTDKIGQYAFDRAGHLLHLQTAEIRRLINQLLPGKFRTITRDARIQVLGRELRYPFQANLHGLPSLVKAEGLRCYLEAAAAEHKKPRHFQDWAEMTFGQKFSELFFEPYNRKLWTVDPVELTLEWMGNYVPQPEMARVIRGAFSDIPEGGGYNAVFDYPRQGGIECLAQALAKHIPNLKLNARVLQIDLGRRIIAVQGLGYVSWKRLISTVPLPALVALLKSPPQAVIAAAQKLRSNSVLVVNLGVQRACIHPAHWIYFPEEKYCFYRVGFPGNFGCVAPKGSSALYAEVACPAGTGWDKRKSIAQQVRKDLVKANLLTWQDKIEVEHLQYMPYAYVIFDKYYAQARKTILTYLEKNNIASIGRWGHWEYSAMEDALLAGKQAGQACQ